MTTDEGRSEEIPRRTQVGAGTEGAEERAAAGCSGAQAVGTAASCPERGIAGWLRRPHRDRRDGAHAADHRRAHGPLEGDLRARDVVRSEEHTSELQSRGHLVCRLLLEKKKKKNNQTR